MVNPDKIVHLLEEEIADMSIGYSLNRKRLDTIIDLIAEALCESEYIQELYGNTGSI